MKRGYYKGELRPCPYCEEAGEIIDPGFFKKAGCSNEECALNFPDITAMTIPEWNSNDTFDKAIDALIGLMVGIDGLPPLTAIEGVLSEQWKFAIKTIESLTDLTWEGALEIYKERMETNE